MSISGLAMRMQCCVSVFEKSLTAPKSYINEFWTKVFNATAAGV